MRTHQARLSKITLIVALALAVQDLVAQINPPAQQRFEFSAAQAVDYAKKNSVQVRNALLDIRIRQQGNREITSAAFPQMSGSVNVTKYIDLPTSLIPAEFFGGPAGTFIPVQFGTEYNGTYGFTIDQLLFDGQVFVGLQARKASIDFYTQAAQVTEEQIKANVYKIYYQLVVGQKQISTIDANITRAEKLLSDTRALFENGFRERLDVDKTTVNLANLRTERIKVENTIKTGLIGLKYLMGMPVNAELVLTDTLSDDAIKQNILADSVRYEDRKEYQLLQTQIKLNKYDIKRHQFTYIPTVRLNGNYSRNAQRNSFDFFKGGRDWFTITYIGLSINVPIFDGFAKDSRIKSARLALQKSENQLAGLENQIDQEVNTAQIDMRDAIITLDMQKKNMELANEVYNQTKIKYDNGLGSNLEITNAETDLRTAQNNYYSALYDAIIARIDYLKAIGKL
jgi:outer membrane protein TolC